MFENMANGEIYDTEEKARDAIIEQIDDFDIIDTAEFEYTTEDFIKELARLESPMYFKLVDKTIERLFDEYIADVDEEEEEEDE